MPKILDLFCGAGGAAMGYHRAGFDVIGIDLNPQPRYPFKFHQDDALCVLDCFLRGSELYGHRIENFAGIHASPPCQRFSAMTKRWGRSENHPDLIGNLRDRLQRIGKPFVIENVMGAPLRNDLFLCGSMFGLKVRRHRLFECNFPVSQPVCDHERQGRPVGVYGHAGGTSKRDSLTFGGTDSWRKAMGVDWMTGKELAQAIPPAYTEYIGKLMFYSISRLESLQPMRWTG